MLKMWLFAIAISFLVTSGVTEICDDETVLLQHSSQVSSKLKQVGDLQTPTFHGPDGGGMCGWSSVFGPAAPLTVGDARTLFESKCVDLYPPGLCGSLAEEAFRVFDNAYHSTVALDLAESHPLFCKEVSDLIHASSDHQRDASHAAALLARSSSSSGNAILEKSLQAKGSFLPELDDWQPPPAWTAQTTEAPAPPPLIHNGRVYGDDGMPGGDYGGSGGGAEAASRAAAAVASINGGGPSWVIDEILAGIDDSPYTDPTMSRHGE